MPTFILVALLLQFHVGSSVPARIQAEWNATVHQVVVVKASTLMPPPLQRQILRHREEILKGCLDVLRRGQGNPIDREELRKAAEGIARALGKRTPFDSICYDLGRLSSIAMELAPVTALGESSTEQEKIRRFRDFLTAEYRAFPLVINREGEAYLLRGSLEDYIEYMVERNTDRRRMLIRALSEENDDAWRDQRSMTYGMATLIYNDMVLDTARIWLYVWQQAGGEIGDAPYFKLGPAGNR
jgi:hypothetical protein